jgi:hypothetical protein
MPANRVYSKTTTMSDDKIHAFETSQIKLESAYISVATQAMKFGDAVSQNYQVAAGGYFFLRKLDVSKLYFRNAGAGANGTVNIIGTI